jgi:hypothetical protein
VLLSAWGIIDNASSAEQVELVACNEGVKLAARWVPRPAILESDCLTAVNLILKAKFSKIAMGLCCQGAGSCGN